MNDCETISRIESRLLDPLDASHHPDCRQLADPASNCECPALMAADRAAATDAQWDAQREEGVG